MAVTNEIELMRFFENKPAEKALYHVFAEKVLNQFANVAIRVQKSQIAFSNNHNFAFVWLPIRKMKGRPESYIVISFGLSYRLDSPRIVEATEPYPNRWTHHVIVQCEADIDVELMRWINDAYVFAEGKR